MLLNKASCAIDAWEITTLIGVLHTQIYVVSMNGVNHTIVFYIKQRWRLLNSFIDLIPTNNPRSFQSKCVTETTLPDFHIMTMSVLKMHFCKLPPRVINYRDFKIWQWKVHRFLTLYSQWIADWLQQKPEKLFEISENVFNKHISRKKKYIRRNNKPFMTKGYSQKPLCKEHVSERNS